MLSPLTKRQKEFLDYISSCIEKNGYAPSLHEIKNHFKLKAISTIHEHLENLKNKGYIKKEMNQARGIQTYFNANVNDKSCAIPMLHILENCSLHPNNTDNTSISVDRTFLHPEVVFENCFAVRIKGVSMLKDGYANNDVLLFEESSKYDTSEIVLLQDKSGKCCIEKIKSKSPNEEFVKGRLLGLIRFFK